jgi:two-component system, cell cycle sensor histidine kinase and response regulator CckA
MVEDETSLIQLMQEILQQHDYRVLTAASGAEALRVWDQHDGRIDLLLTDMFLPGGMTGDNLAAELKRRKPALKVIYASGNSSRLSNQDFSRNDIFLLPKPFQPDEVVRLVRDALDGTHKGQCQTLPPAQENCFPASAPA